MSAPQFHASQINNAQRHSKTWRSSQKFVREPCDAGTWPPLGSVVGGRELKVAVVQLHHHLLGHCFYGLPMQPWEPLLRVLETRERNLVLNR